MKHYKNLLSFLLSFIISIGLSYLAYSLYYTNWNGFMWSLEAKGGFIACVCFVSLVIYNNVMPD